MTALRILNLTHEGATLDRGRSLILSVPVLILFVCLFVCLFINPRQETEKKHNFTRELQFENDKTTVWIKMANTGPCHLHLRVAKTLLNTQNAIGCHSVTVVNIQYY